MEKILSKREQNKAQKKELFIEAAKKLFIQNGFEATSIDEVAQTAGLTKRTLYQYFTSKEDLFYAIIMIEGQKLLKDYLAAFEKGKTALEKIHLGNQAHLRFYTDHPDMFRLLNYRPAAQSSTDASPHFREIANLEMIRMEHFATIIEEGRTDGSISPGLDMKKAVFFAFYSAFSLLYTVSMSDDGVWNMMGIDKHDFLRFSFDVMTDAIAQCKNPEES